MTCIPVVFFIVVLHLGGQVSYSCLLHFGVIWYLHPSPFVDVMGVGGVGAAATVIAAIAMVFLMIL